MRIPFTRINTGNSENTESQPSSPRRLRHDLVFGDNPEGVSTLTSRTLGLIGLQPLTHRGLQVTTIGQTSLGLANNDQHQAESRLLATELAAWQADLSVTGNKKTASQRIQEAFDLQSTELFLDNLNLTALPSCINKLTTLRLLNACNNCFDTFPDDIYQLTRLINLNLDSNNFESISSKMGQLSQLRSLRLNNNRLTTLPPEMHSLRQLRFLGLTGNQFEIFPAIVCQLSELRYLLVGNNRFESIPTEIIQLDQLTTLNLSRIPNLRELPINLGQLQHLSDLITRVTGIPDALRNTILAQCAALRASKEGGTSIFSQRLATWKAASRIEVDFTKIEQLDDEQKRLVDDWLKRLEETRDFSRCQEKLAKIVCEMLQDLSKNDGFKELFFVQITANLERCEDRSAMAFNEIYVAWKITSLDDTASVEDRLQLMTQAAKTLALRTAISLRIVKRQKELDEQYHSRQAMLPLEQRRTVPKTILAESVEIYLFYETALRGELNLLSAIENMCYATSGQCNWIDNKDLVSEVNATYHDYLIQLPVFQKILESYSAYKDELTTRLSPFNDGMEALSEEPRATAVPDSPEHLEWQIAMNLLTRSREEAKAALDREWLKKLGDYT